MIDAWILWLVLVGAAIGLLAAWLLLARLPRDESDVSSSERLEEANWISRTIEYHGGIAPQTLVKEVLDLHQAYLDDPRLRRGAQETDDQLPPTPPVPPPAVRHAPPPAQQLQPPGSQPPPPVPPVRPPTSR